jgi:hypothetical protein
MKNGRLLPCVTGLAVAIILPAAASAEEEGGWSLEGSTLDLGLGYQFDDAFFFGRYSGRTDKGPYVIADADIVARSNDRQRLDIQAYDLGLDSRYIDVDYTGSSGYRLFLEYDQIPNNLFDDAQTPFVEAAPNRLVLPERPVEPPGGGNGQGPGDGTGDGDGPGGGQGPGDGTGGGGGPVTPRPNASAAVHSNRRRRDSSTGPDPTRRSDSGIRSAGTPLRRSSIAGSEDSSRGRTTAPPDSRCDVTLGWLCREATMITRPGSTPARNLSASGSSMPMQTGPVVASMATRSASRRVRREVLAGASTTAVTET